GLEVFKLRGSRSFAVALRLLKDGDPDVVLQSVLILDHLRDPRALEPLRGALSHSDPNVVQAAILAIGRLGNARSIPDLLPFLDADPWLQTAAVQALGDLRSPLAGRHHAADRALDRPPARLHGGRGDRPDRRRHGLPGARLALDALFRAAGGRGGAGAPRPRPGGAVGPARPVLWPRRVALRPL